ncbi:MAG TPA: LLM class flavin-dependent oxidoreductase [Chloroflexota bacterium]|jgi:alkanesulfonate monooxygenase SsuD/methylene tetrahydromethanopterin reductase-like flavin-dependent oxidoreductase (luciferase family)|nr:LLM class flavin-dependent oxidoreductase [Chloroflexota bacterium]
MTDAGRVTSVTSVTSTMAPSSGRLAPLGFGWRLPMWDPGGQPAGEWLPAVHANLSSLRGKFDSVWLSDHFIPGTPWMPPEPDTLECWTATAAFAMAYPEYRYGQIVLANSFRQPSLLAKMAATLQLLTGGRLILGLGAGWMEREYRAYGYPFPPAPVRLQQLSEAVQLIRRMWTDAPASFRGRHYRIEEAYCQPLPRPAPPIMIGAAGEQLALRIVARHADWWNLSDGSLESFARKAAVLAQHCEAVGRDPSSILYTWQCQAVALGDSEGEARAVAERSPFYRHMPPANALVGTPEQIRERLEAFVALGVRHFMLRFLDFPSPEGALRFAAEVAPRLRP